jgi:hypothetical protein
MAKDSYSGANLVATYDTFASWLTKTNQLVYDMSTVVVTTNASAVPAITSGNVFVNGYFGANNVYITSALQGGTANTPAALSVTSALTVSNVSTFSANVTITGSANASVNVNAVGILANNGTFNNNLVVGNTATLNTATAVLANVTTANISTLGVTSLATLASANITGAATVGTTLTIGNVVANTTVVTVGNSSVNVSINSTSFSGISNNSLNLGGVSLATLQGQITGNAAAAYSNATSYADTKAATAYSNAITYADTKSAAAYTNAVNYVIAGGYVHTGNVGFVGNTTSVLSVGNTASNVVVNSTVISIGTATINSTTFSGTANNATNLGGVAASGYQTTAGLSANVATLTANAATFLGNSSGTIANVASWITGNSATAYSNAINVAGNGISNGVWVAANALYANNAGALNGIVANMAAPSDGYVVAYDAGTSRLVLKNPSNISVALNSNTVVANTQLQVGSNGTTYVANIYGNSILTSATIRANTVMLMVDSGSVLINSSALVTSTLFAGNTAANVNIATGVITLQNSTTSATVNATTFSGTSNNATNLGGVSLTTLQGQITGNSSAAYTNAVNFAANASNINTGTLSYAYLPSGLVNTSAAFTMAGVITFNSNVVLAGNTTSTLVVGNNVTSNIVANSTVLTIQGTATVGSVTANSTVVSVGNSTVNTTINSTSFSGTANNSVYLNGSTLATIQSQITGNAATAYTNATSFVTAGGYTVTGDVTLNGSSLYVGNNATYGILSINASGNVTTSKAYITLSGNGTSSNLNIATSATNAGGKTPDIYIRSGNTTGACTSGLVQIATGSGPSGVGGIGIVAGTNSNTTNGGGGSVTINAGGQSDGTGGGAGTIQGGNITIRAGSLTNPSSNVAVQKTGSVYIDVGTAANTSATYGDILIGANGTIANLQIGSANTAKTIIYANGSLGSSGFALTSNGSAAVWTDINTSITGNAATAYANAVANAAALYQTTAGLSANVATLTALNSTQLGGVAAANYVNTSGSYTISGVFTHNANIVFSGNSTSQVLLGTIAAGNGVAITNSSISVGNNTVNTTINATSFSGTANNATNLGGVAAGSYALTSSLSAYQTTAGLSANVATLTANNATNLGGVAAANYVNTSGAYTISGIHTHTANVVVGNSTANVAISNNQMAFSNASISGFFGNVIVVTGTTYTFANSDSGKIFEFSNTSAITVTLANTVPAGFNITAVQTGTGNVTFSAAAGSTITKKSSIAGANTNGQYAAAIVYVRSNPGATAVWYLGGDLV